MARVTVEDCVERLPNRFELVMVAAQRARKISSGSSLTIDRDNDKNPVVALREIAEETVNSEQIKEDLIRSRQRIVSMDDEDDTVDLMDGEEEALFASGPVDFSDNAEDDDDDFSGDDAESSDES